MLIAMSAFDEITVSDKAAGGVPEVPENPSSETLVAPAAEAQPEQPIAEVEKPSDEGAPTGEVSSEQTTEEEKFILTGKETPEMLKEKHGDNWAIKTARRTLPLIEQAGGMQNLRNGAAIVSYVHSPEATGTGLIQEIAKVSRTQAQAFVNDIYSSNVREQPDMTLRFMFDMPDLTFDEVKKAITESREFASGEPAELQDELATLSPTLRKEIEESRAIRQQFPELQKKVQGFETNREQEEVTTLGQELYSSVFSVVQERKAKLGLDILPTDSDQVKYIKQDLNDYLSDEKIEKEFEGNKDNARLTDRAISYIKKRDKDGAFAFVEPLTVAAEITFENMLKSPRVSHALAQLKSVMESQSKPKDPTARDEIVAGAPAGFVPENAFAKGQQEGMSPFDVSVQLAGQGKRAAA